jgi:hypothetical protein
MTVQQKVDTGFAVAQQVYSLASAYYQLNAPAMSLQDSALFAKYLQGFKLALETGEGLAGFAMRWYQFQAGY